MTIAAYLAIGIIGWSLFCGFICLLLAGGKLEDPVDDCELEALELIDE